MLKRKLLCTFVIGFDSGRVHMFFLHKKSAWSIQMVHKSRMTNEPPQGKAAKKNDTWALMSSHV